MKVFLKIWLSEFFKIKPLKKKAALLIILLISYLFVLSILFYLEFSFEKSKIENSIKENVINIDELLTEKLDRTEIVMKKMIREIKKNPHDKEYIFNVMEIYKTEPYFVDNLFWTVFSWTDENDDIIVDTKYKIMKTPYDLSNRDYIGLTRKYPDIFFIGKPVLGSTSKKWMIPGGVGAFLDEKYLGSMTIGLQIEPLSMIVRKKIEDENIKLILVYDENEIIFEVYKTMTNSFQNRKYVEKEDFLRLIKKSKNQNKLLMEFNIFNDNKDLICVKKIEKYPLFILVKYDKTKVKEKLIASYLNKATVSFVIFLILFFIILSFGYGSHNMINHEKH